jgi:hypothetical protein
VRIDWQLDNTYDEIGGETVLRKAIEDALASVPMEHLRRLDALVICDADPRGKSLGIWRQDHRGCVIELYAAPHVIPLLGLPSSVRDFALRLHLAYTLFHEVGHHVTRVLNPRATPPRKAALVEVKIERWADEYAEKRLRKFVERWNAPGGIAETAEAAYVLQIALRALRLDTIFAAKEPGTKLARAAS